MASNLAVLCLDCHSRVTGNRGLGRSYSKAEVRKYKLTWERHIAQTRRPSKVRVAYKRELITQIDLLICEAIAAESTARAQLILDVLYELHIYRGADVDLKILEGLQHLALMSGLGRSPLAGSVAELTWQLNWHFIGPNDVPMNKAAQRRVLKTIRVLGTLGEFGCQFNRRKKMIASVSDSLENYLSMAIWYKRREIAQAVVTAYADALEACTASGKPHFVVGQRVLKASLGRALRLLKDTPRNWEAERSKLAEMRTAALRG